MKVLQICNKIPFPPKDGGALAMYMMADGLMKKGVEVKVLAVNPSRDYHELNDLSAEFYKKSNFEAIEVDTSIKPIDAFINLFTNDSYNVSRFYSKEFEDRLQSILKEGFDIIQLESLFVCPYLPAIRRISPGARIVLRSHNVEHKIWEALANRQSGIKKRYLKMLAKRLKSYELDIINKIDALLPITKDDEKAFLEFGYTGKLCTIPFAINIPPPYNDEVEYPGFFHLGSMDWMPNQEAILWFLKEIWPIVTNDYSTAKVYIAGKKMPDSIRAYHSENTVIVGEIDDAAAFIRSKGVMVVPLLTGSGMRVKIIEGMAMGKTVITTPIGVEGIPAEDGKSVLIGKNAKEFANLIVQCIKNPNFAAGIGENARQLITENFNQERLSAKVVEFYKTLFN